MIERHNSTIFKVKRSTTCNKFELLQSSLKLNSAKFVNFRQFAFVCSAIGLLLLASSIAKTLWLNKEADTDKNANVEALHSATTGSASAISALNKRSDWRRLKVLVLAQSSGYSHFHLNAKLAEILAERGHYVVIIITKLLSNYHIHSFIRGPGCHNIAFELPI